MSDYGGCLICGQVLSRDDNLMCSDCDRNDYMKQTGTLAKYIMLTDSGPIEVGPPRDKSRIPDNDWPSAGYIDTGPTQGGPGSE